MVLAIMASCRLCWLGLLLVCAAGPASAQNARQNTATGQEHAEHEEGWTVHAGGVAFATFNRQGGPRGRAALDSQNWMMAMGMRRVGQGLLTVSGMFSAEPFTVGPAGYPELLQEGESYRGLQITDRQHPHDLFMQLSAAWRVSLGDVANLTIAGGPVGEAALGPVAFMHRPSAIENPIAPLSHHIFDSTHIAHGVVSMAVDRGPFAVEGSMLRGREPDEHRYDIELGALDSWSVRAWFRPSRQWNVQASHGFLREPEQLEPGNQRRTNASVSWLREENDSRFDAITAGYGQTVRNFSTVRALLLETTHQIGRTSVFARFEDLTVETEILLFPFIVHQPHPGELVDRIRALSVGGVRDIARINGFRIGLGGDVVLYRLPELLQFTHGNQPRSFHAFVRLRPPEPGGRMWNMTMGQLLGRNGSALHH